MITAYSFSVSIDFQNGVNTSLLSSEISSSAITAKLSGVSVVGDDCSISFMAALSASEQVILNDIVAAHSGAAEVAPEVLRVSQEKPTVKERWYHSVNWCDPTTWQHNAIMVTNGTATPTSEDRRKWKLPHEWIVDMYHGKTPEEWRLREKNNCIFEVYVDGVKKEEDTPLLYAGNKKDFEMDYLGGVITFHNSIDVNSVVTATYKYAVDSTTIIAPEDGELLRVQSSETQFGVDFDMRDTVIFQTFAYASFVSSVFGVDIPTLQTMLENEFGGGTRDGLMTFLGNRMMTGMPMQRDLMPSDKVPIIGSSRTYKTCSDLVAHADGNFAILPKFGGDVRGFRTDLITLPFEYRGSKDLDYRIGAEFRIWLENHQPFGVVGKSYGSSTFKTIVDRI